MRGAGAVEGGGDERLMFGEGDIEPPNGAGCITRGRGAGGGIGAPGGAARERAGGAPS